MSMEKFLRIQEVTSLTGMSKSAIYAGIRAGRFPRPAKIGARAIAWSSSTLAEWQKKCVQEAISNHNR